MSFLDDAIGRLTDLDRPSVKPFGGNGAGFNPNNPSTGLGGGIPDGYGSPTIQTFFDPFSSTQQSVFAWDTPGQGWDQGYWFTPKHSFSAFLMHSVAPSQGNGSATFTRAGTTTQANADGSVSTVAVNTPPFDYISAPDQQSRPLYRADSTAALLLYQASGNLNRRSGTISFWMRPLTLGSVPTGTDRVFFQSGNWKLYVPAGSIYLTLVVPMLDGTTVSTTIDMTGFCPSQWTLIAATWDRAAGEVKLGYNEHFYRTVNTTQRYAEFGTTFGVSQGTTASAPCNSYIFDFKAWNSALSASELATLYLIGSRGLIPVETIAVGLAKNIDTIPVVSVATYTAGKVAGGLQTLTSVVRQDGGTGLLLGLVLRDKSNSKVAMDILLFDSNPAGSTVSDASTLNVVDADLSKCIGVVSIAAADWVDVGAGAVATKLSIGLPVKANASTDLYAVIVPRSSITFASASDLVLRTSFLQD